MKLDTALRFLVLLSKKWFDMEDFEPRGWWWGIQTSDSQSTEKGSWGRKALRRDKQSCANPACKQGRVWCLDKTKRKITKIRTRDRSAGQKWKTTQEGSVNVYWERLLHIILKRDSINPTLHILCPFKLMPSTIFLEGEKKTEYKWKSTIWSKSASDCVIAFTEPYLQILFVP